MSDNQEEYLKFNTDSISTLIKQKLEDKFPDVVYEGSSANIISETISSVFSLLLFQLNRTASNSSFSKTQSLDTLIQQTKILGYNPVGWGASTLFCDLYADNIPDASIYTIPRYSTISTDIGMFSTCVEYEFSYNGDGRHEPLLYDLTFKGGSWVEHPTIISNGEINLKIPLPKDTPIDHNTIHVYVEIDGKWRQWEQVDTLFFSKGDEMNFEARLNTIGSYDVMFGDGVNGLAPPDKSKVAIYYLSTNITNDTLLTGVVDSKIYRFSTGRLDDILVDILDTETSIILHRMENLVHVVNTAPNTKPSEPESLDTIRKNAPIISQTRKSLITKQDYSIFVESNFSEFVSDVLILNNEEYLNEYIKYYYDLGMENPHLENRALYNQVKYADACNFNNIYIFVIPKHDWYLNGMQKKLIIDATSKNKTTVDIIPSDPIYLEFGVATPINEILVEDLDTSSIEIVKDANVNRSDNDIISEVYMEIVKYFDNKNSNFGESVEISTLNSILLGISGVHGIFTVNGSAKTAGVNFYKFDDKYKEKAIIASNINNFSKSIFVPRLYDNNILNKISINS